MRGDLVEGAVVKPLLVAERDLHCEAVENVAMAGSLGGTRSLPINVVCLL